MHYVQSSCHASCGTRPPRLVRTNEIPVVQWDNQWEYNHPIIKL